MNLITAVLCVRSSRDVRVPWCILVVVTLSALHYLKASLQLVAEIYYDCVVHSRTARCAMCSIASVELYYDNLDV